MSNSELAVSYAALILADDDLEVTSDKLTNLIKAANIDDALEGKNVKEMLLNVGSGGGAAGAPTGGAGPVANEVPVDEAKEEKKEEGTVYVRSSVYHAGTDAGSLPEKEESDEDMGFGLFD
ncbi:MAG: hypothetical protein L6R35_005762 [Caloplaca aegaea]|nr:MAG: hypothetical protein L6R35_005762 [Caloplaca aegaea]